MSALIRNKVHEYRKKFGLTQEQLAKKLGVTRQTIISIEQGKYVASLPLALRIARLFRVRVEDIFIMEDEQNDRFRNF